MRQEQKVQNEQLKLRRQQIELEKQRQQQQLQHERVSDGGLRDDCDCTLYVGVMTRIHETDVFKITQAELVGKCKLHSHFLQVRQKQVLEQERFRQQQALEEQRYRQGKHYL